MSPQRSRWKYVALIAASALSGVILGWSPVGAPVDGWVYDLFLRLRPTTFPSSVIFAIDEDSLEAHGGLLRLREPLARALEILSRHEPAAVAIDIVLTEPGSEPANRRLEEALDQIPNVVLAAHLRTTRDSGTSEWQQPLDRFRERAAAVGHVHAEPDDDGVCRRVLLAKAGRSQRLWALALEAYRLAQGGGPILETVAGLQLPSGNFIPAPLREARSLRIRYVSPSTPITRLSLKQLLDNPQTAEFVRGRAVFIGVVVQGGLDRYLMTPYSFGEAMSGVEINANVYETLAGGDFLVTARPSLVLAVSLGFAILLGVAFFRLEGRKALFTAALVLLAAHATPPVFFWNGTVLAFAPVAASAWLCFLTGSGYHYLGVRGRLATAESQRDRYQKAVHYVTHEMRTPLTTIQGSSELISRYALSDQKRKEIAERIHSESERLGRLVETFLSVEKLSAGRLNLRREPMEPGRLLAECVDRARPLAERKQIRLIQSSQVGEPLWGDRELLEYACYNLVTNAVKYSPADTRITVRAWPDNDKVCLSVEDQGYGMDPTELKNIFKRFFRTRKAEQTGERGSGLGLALVEEIVVQHGGSIQVESGVNQGSRFTIVLPRNTGRQPAHAKAQPARES